jgi:hypothetical protein
MNYETYEQKYNGTTRLIYRAYISEGFIEAQSLERLKELINNHAPTNEGTFKNINKMKTSKILKAIKEMNKSELIELNNLYSQIIGSNDEVYYNDEEFFKIFFQNGLEVARSIFYGEYNYGHEYVKFNGYGNLESFDYFDIDDLCELPYEMAEYISENFNDFKHLFN